MQSLKNILLLGSLAILTAKGTVLYSTNGTVSPGFSTASGSTASRSTGTTLAFAMEFTPTTTGTLDSIEVEVISLTPAITTIDFLVTTNSGGVPGLTLDTLHVPLTTSNALETANSNNHPLLTAGTLYWLEITPPATNGNVRWDLASPGTSGTTWNSSSNTPVTGNLDAFELSGTTAPEPATILFAACGLACFAIAKKASKS
jgi:hypothetical protein